MGSLTREEKRSGTIRFTDPNLATDKPCSTLPGQQFVVRDPAAVPLARRQDRSTNVVVAIRKLPGWTSVYSAAAPLPAPFLRSLAREAHVHIYTSDPAFLNCASENFLMLAAGSRWLVRANSAATSYRDRRPVES